VSKKSEFVLSSAHTVKSASGLRADYSHLIFMMIALSGPTATIAEVLLVGIAAVSGGVALFWLLTVIFHQYYYRGVDVVRKGEGEEDYFKQDAWFASTSTPPAYRYMNDPNSKDKIRIPPDASHIHLIVLVHGWNGRPCSLGYMKDALERQAAASASASSSGVNTCLVIHAATANQGKTSDGVAAGGCRLAREVDEIIQNIKHQIIMIQQQQRRQQHQQEDRSDCKNNENQQVILSLSFVGYSLGASMHNMPSRRFRLSFQNKTILPAPAAREEDY
jgi:Putative serine esterase (DUF676)